jgi:hypothetical protein
MPIPTHLKLLERLHANDGDRTAAVVARLAPAMTARNRALLAKLRLDAGAVAGEEEAEAKEAAQTPDQRNLRTFMSAIATARSSRNPTLSSLLQMEKDHQLRARQLRVAAAMEGKLGGKGADALAARTNLLLMTLDSRDHDRTLEVLDWLGHGNPELWRGTQAALGDLEKLADRPALFAPRLSLLAPLAVRDYTRRCAKSPVRAARRALKVARTTLPLRRDEIEARGGRLDPGDPLESALLTCAGRDVPFARFFRWLKDPALFAARLAESGFDASVHAPMSTSINSPARTLLMQATDAEFRAPIPSPAHGNSFVRRLQLAHDLGSRVISELLGNLLRQPRFCVATMAPQTTLSRRRLNRLGHDELLCRIARYKMGDNPLNMPRARRQALLPAFQSRRAQREHLMLPEYLCASLVLGLPATVATARKHLPRETAITLEEARLCARDAHFVPAFLQAQTHELYAATYPPTLTRHEVLEGLGALGCGGVAAARLLKVQWDEARALAQTKCKRKARAGAAATSMPAATPHRRKQART